MNIHKYVLNLITAFLLITSIGLSGCAHVAAWERGVLAKPQMAVDLPMQSVTRAHNYSSREAAASAHSAGGGGGCGCY